MADPVAWRGAWTESPWRVHRRHGAVGDMQVHLLVYPSGSGTWLWFARADRIVQPDTVRQAEVDGEASTVEGAKELAGRGARAAVRDVLS